MNTKAEEEDAIKNNVLGTASPDDVIAENEAYTNAMPTIGYAQIDKADMPNQGLQYPDNVKFAVRAATTSEVAHWSSLDNTADAIKIYNYISYIVEKCIEVTGGKTGDIKDADKLWFALKVHEMTFAETEAPTILNCTCPSCKTKWKNRITAQNVKIETYSDALAKYRNPVTGALDIKTKTIPLLSLSQSSMSTGMFAIEYITKKGRTWANDNASFMQWAQMQIPFGTTATEALFDKLYVKWRSYSKQELALALDLVKMSTIKPINKLTVVCTNKNCRQSSDQDFDLEGGIRSLFLPVSDITSELL